MERIIIGLCAALLLVFSLPGQARSLNILALGDSYTIGEGVTPQERWPYLLGTRLAGHGYTAPNIQYLAATGWTAADLLRAMQQTDLPVGHDLITVMVGVNNQYQGGDIDVYKYDLAKILQRAVRLAGGNNQRVVMLSIPDYSISPMVQEQKLSYVNIRNDVRRFNRVARQVADQNNVRFVDISRQVAQAEGRREYFAADGLHFSSAMHSLWADAVTQPALVAIGHLNTDIATTPIPPEDTLQGATPLVQENGQGDVIEPITIVADPIEAPLAAPQIPPPLPPVQATGGVSAPYTLPATGDTELIVPIDVRPKAENGLSDYPDYDAADEEPLSVVSEDAQQPAAFDYGDQDFESPPVGSDCHSLYHPGMVKKRRLFDCD